MIDGKNVSGQPVRNDLITYDSIDAYGKLQQEMITRLVICWTIFISKNVMR